MRLTSKSAPDVFVPIGGDKPILITTESMSLNLIQIIIAKASVPDYLSNWVLKEYADILAPAVTDIIDTSFQECKVPSAYKLADVSPVPRAPMVEDSNKHLRPSP